MRSFPLSNSIDKVIKLKLKAIDMISEELIEPITKVGNPEDLIKKPYESWTQRDFQMLSQIYGSGDNTPLSNLIFKKTFERVKELEGEEL